MTEKTNKQQIKITFPEALRGGAYSNNMFVTHTREEFVVDFMMITPPIGSVTSRVVTSPGHMKRMISALKENLDKYEGKFGKITEADQPHKPQIGFHPSQE